MFTVEDIVTEVRRLAAAEPHFVYGDQPGAPGPHEDCGYAGCRPYTTEGRPCIVGQALINLGVDREALADKVMPASALAIWLAERGYLDHQGGYPTTTTGRRPWQWLDCVQGQQDQRYSWGKAVRDADRRVPIVR